MRTFGGNGSCARDKKEVGGKWLLVLVLNTDLLVGTQAWEKSHRSPFRQKPLFCRKGQGTLCLYVSRDGLRC